MNNRETHRASEIINNNNTYLIKDYLKKKKRKKVFYRLLLYTRAFKIYSHLLSKKFKQNLDIL